MLLEHETQKMRELEEQYQAELKEWKGQLRPRKQVRHRRRYHSGFRGLVVAGAVAISSYANCAAEPYDMRVDSCSIDFLSKVTFK